jgi:hypothetical protein
MMLTMKNLSKILKKLFWLMVFFVNSSVLLAMDFDDVNSEYDYVICQSSCDCDDFIQNKKTTTASICLQDSSQSAVLTQNKNANERQNNNGDALTNDIIMKIYPEYTTEIKRKIGGRFAAIVVTIEGFKKDQIEVDANVEWPNPVNLLAVKKINYLNRGDRLIVKKHFYERGKWEFVDVGLSGVVLDRILNYMLYDLSDKKRCCVNFLVSSFSEVSFTKTPYWTFWGNGFSFDDKNQLKLGDGVILFYITNFIKISRDTLVGCVRNYSLNLIHVAICLGDDLYISQMGAGGKIVVQTMEAMLGFWNSNHFCAIDLKNIQEKNDVAVEIQMHFR